MWLFAALVCTLAQPRAVGDVVVAANPALVTADGRPRNERAIEFDLVNRTPQAVTAWYVAYAYTLSDGTKRSGGVGLNSPRGYPDPIIGRQYESGAIPPIETIRRQAGIGDLHDLVVISLDVRVGAVVFADGSWRGDIEQVTFFFDTREKYYANYQLELAAARAGLAAGGGREGVKVALDYFDAHGKKDDGGMKTLRHNFEMFLEVPPSINRSPDAFLQDSAASAELNLKAIEANRHPKPGFETIKP